jgi:peptide deformylase
MNYQTGDILRKKARGVDTINNRTRSSLEDMVETMYHADGAGLAAPQVGISRRLVVLDIGEGLIKLINPVIVQADGAQQEPEGCLSIPVFMVRSNAPKR